MTGCIFTDYALGRQRIDEVWNYSSIVGTGIAQWGIIADSHIFGAKGAGWYYFYNSSGAQCTATPSGFLAQDAFSHASSYVGNATVPGRPVFHFASHFPFPLHKLAVDLFVDATAGVPVLMNVPAIPPALDGSQVFYADFAPVSDPWPDPLMFNPPGFCAGAGLEATPGCTKSSLRS